MFVRALAMECGVINLSHEQTESVTHVKIGHVNLMKHTTFPHLCVLAAITALSKLMQRAEDQLD